ncbi:hypothetical protein [Burkholderia cepacia]|nr:hypothetical protein [Burkholderia cepacia]MDO5943360.1 hypothetical protein [Burkholderia cepacia]
METNTQHWQHYTSEEQARDNAYDEMEGEGFNTDDTMADGYFLKFIEEK